MYRNILVPLDGSPLSEAALPYAKALARRTGAGLTLIRAAHYASLHSDVAVEQLRSIERAEGYLEHLVKDLAAEGYVAQAGAPFGGSTPQWIVEESDMRHADLVVMATHDRLGADRWLHGSVAEMVVHRSSVPVMLVHNADANELAQRFTASQPTLIVPFDGSDLGEAAVPVAGDLAEALGAVVVRLAVMSESDQPSVEGADLVVRSGDPATEIANAAREYRAAAVVMATHGRTGVVRSILGSVAGGVLHHSTCPVVLVRTTAVRAAREPATTMERAN